MKGSDPLNISQLMITLGSPINVGTMTFCPHVSVIMVGSTSGGLIGGGTKCGTPM